MKYQHVLRAFFIDLEARGAIWAILESKYFAIREFLRLQASGVKFSEEELAAISAGRRPAEPAPPGSVAVIPIRGVISHRARLLDDISGPGASSTESMGQAFDAALADTNVKAILFDIDSPGGTVYGVPELADKIHAARGQKPIVASINALGASAAYWLASSADEVHITPSGEAGSIGVFAEHLDISKFLEAEGVRPTLITYGKYKAEAHQYQPLGEEARAHIQEAVDRYGENFVSAVARNRNESQKGVRERYGQGRIYGAEAAKELGMVDRVLTFEDSLRRAAKLGGLKAEEIEPTVTGFLAAYYGREGRQALEPAAAGVTGQASGAARDPLELEPEASGEPAPTAPEAGAVAPHSTRISNGAWDGPGNEKRLNSPMPVGTARKAYAWIDDAGIKNGEIQKTDCRFIHHEVDGKGAPGAANMTACSSGIGVLNGARGGTNIPAADKRGVYNHLAKHLKDGGQEPPEFKGEASEDTAAELELAQIRVEFGI